MQHGKHHRIATLDGLRGLAMCVVLALHIATESPDKNALSSLLAAGWVSVDVFFALSGFLITGILLDSLGKPGYFRIFYWRRILRIWPAYLTALTVLTIVALGVAYVNPESADAQRFLTEKTWYWLHATNLLIARTARFDSATFGTSPYWSLAVEEQFYLLWPLVVYAIARTPKRIAVFSACIIVASPVVRYMLWRRGVDSLAIYVLTPTRVDSIAWGALVAGCWRIDRGATRDACWLLLAIGVIGFAGLMYRLGKPDALSPSFFTLGYSFAGMASAGLVIYCLTVRHHTWLHHGTLRATGKYSYAMYLWHMPILYGLKHISDLPFAVFASLAVGLTIIAARFSWIVIEQPAMSLREFVERQPVAEIAD